MGLIVGLLKRLIILFIYFIIFASIVVLIPNLPPYTNFSSIKLDPTQPRTGPLAPNDALNNGKQMYKDKLLGPEAFQLYNGELYTSLATGEIVKISPGGHVTFVTKVGQPCTGLRQEHICGRPLGFQIDEKTNTLYVADAYLGIWKVDLRTDKKQLLVSPNVAINGRVPKIFNSLAVAQNGDLYWTDSSSDFHLKDGAIALLTDPSGRFFYYNAAKNESKVLLDHLWFPNGLVISPDNQFVLISETNKYRIIKYYIDGPKKGKSEVFVDGLPGVPDNLRALPDGSGVLAALYTSFDENNPLLTRSMAETPIVRKFLARIQSLAELPFVYLKTLYPHIVFEDIVYAIGHFNSVSTFAPKISGLVQLDWNGNIIASYYNTDGSLGHISDAIVFGDRLYTGAPHKNNFIGSVPAPTLLLKAFSAKKSEMPTIDTPKVKPPVQKEAKKEEQKQEIPKVTKPVATEPPKPKPITEKPITTTEKPKPATEKPKPATEKPKPAAEKPKPATEKPKPTTEQPKPTTEKPKPVTEKPIEKKVVTPQATTPKPTQTTKADPKVTESKKTTPPPKSETKPTQKSPTTKPMTTETKPEKAQPKPVKEKTEETVKKPVVVKTPEQIPIKEEIPSDTAKPTKEKLKVIKKDGPTEIPNINNV